MKIVLATSNKGKVEEIKNYFKQLDIDFLTPEDLNIENFEVVEDGNTLEENAFKKAKALYEIAKIPTMADDTGLFVKALNYKPGVKSHRYASEDGDDELNRKKLLKNMEKAEDRNAFFKTCICFIDEDGNKKIILGKVNGKILKSPKGENGFGYDPLFMPDGYQQSFSEMSLNLKNKISHRAHALNNFKEFLRENYEICDN
ncbi:MAG: RdgB/HAM1 family non-canonical purine NTP pyrophosphatase [Tissierellia bacterium]|nr:RdgB/HAM1 family non-canonical purine NTP pyrophosphatase [Tissierellia bacterium]